MTDPATDRIEPSPTHEPGGGNPRSPEPASESKQGVELESDSEQREDMETSDSDEGDEFDDDDEALSLLEVGDLGLMFRVEMLTELSKSCWKQWHEEQNPMGLMGCISAEEMIVEMYPTTHPDRPNACASLSFSLLALYNTTQSSEVLEKAMRLQEEALAWAPTNHPCRATLCPSYAALLWARYGETEDVEILEMAIKFQQEALDLCPPDHEDRAQTCEKLGLALWTRYQQTEDIALLERVIKLEEEILDLHPTGHPERASACANLAVSLKLRYKQTGNGALLHQAIALEQEARSLCAEDILTNDSEDGSGLSREQLQATLEDALAQGLYGHVQLERVKDLEVLMKQIGSFLSIPGLSDSSHQCQQLSVFLTTERWEKHQDELALVTMIIVESHILIRHVSNDEARTMWTGKLATSLLARAAQTRNEAMLDTVIQLWQGQLDSLPAEDPKRYALCGDLASSYMTRYNQIGDTAALDRAIALQEEALTLCPLGHSARDVQCTNLAVLIRTRSGHTGDYRLLRRAVDLDEEALAMRDHDHPRRAATCAGLANTYSQIYRLSGDQMHLQRSTELRQEVLDLYGPGHPYRDLACEHLASSLKSRYELTGENVALQRATELEQEALDLRPVGHPNRAISCNNVANSLVDRYGQTKDRALLERAIELHHEALSLISVGRPDRWHHSLALAQLTQLSLPHIDWDVTIGHLHDVLYASSYDNINGVLAGTLGTLLRIDWSALSDVHQHTLLDLHSRAIDVVTVAAGLAVNPDTQLRHTFRGRILGPAAFSLAARLDKLPTGIQLLERARGVIWSQMLHLRDPQLDQVPSDLSAKLQSLIRSPPPPEPVLDPVQPPRLTERLLDYPQRNQLQGVIRAIRSLPELGDFMRGPDIRTLLNVALRNSVVVLVAEEDICHAVLITSGEMPLTWVALAGVTRKTLKDLTFEGIVSRTRGTAIDSGRGMFIARTMAAPNVRLSKLWRAIVRPVLDRLSLLSKARGRDRPRIHWCPTGPFAFVPVHAAGIYEGPHQECCSDYVVSSYTPTLTALIQAQKGQMSLTPQQTKFLAVAAEHTQYPNLPPLKCAVPEVQAVTDIATKSGVSSSVDLGKTTQAEVMAMLQSSHIIHFACHGIQHKLKPYKSHFCLETGDLTVTDLMEMDLKNAFLAYLSACETAKGDETHVDEVIHLAASMLFAGFKSIVATMWAMNDADGPLVATEFYQRLFEGTVIDVDSVPYALDEAVSALRAKGVPPAQWATFIHMGA